MAGLPRTTVSNICPCRASGFLCELSPLLPLPGSGPPPERHGPQTSISVTKSVLFLNSVFEAWLLWARSDLPTSSSASNALLPWQVLVLTALVPTKATTLFNPKSQASVSPSEFYPPAGISNLWKSPRLESRHHCSI